MPSARRVRVTGQVQGVFYRVWTREQAEQLGVSGWVRNRADGSVEAHLEGDEAVLDELTERMRTGPPAARVEAIEIAEADPDGRTGFEVRR